MFRKKLKLWTSIDKPYIEELFYPEYLINEFIKENPEAEVQSVSIDSGNHVYVIYK